MIGLFIACFTILLFGFADISTAYCHATDTAGL